jgi:hypothetical protein
MTTLHSASSTSGSSIQNGGPHGLRAQRKLHLAQNGERTVPGTPIRVVLGELFVELDRA